RLPAVFRHCQQRGGAGPAAAQLLLGKLVAAVVMTEPATARTSPLCGRPPAAAPAVVCSTGPTMSRNRLRPTGRPGSCSTIGPRPSPESEDQRQCPAGRTWTETERDLRRRPHPGGLP